MNRIPIDSPNLGRTKPNLNLNTLGLRTQQTNKFLRNTCTNNSDFLLANRLGAGSYGVVYDARFESNGTTINGAVKFMYEAQKSDSLDEIKIGIELNNNAPDCSIRHYFLDKCDILTSPNHDYISARDDILMIGMEKGINDLTGPLLRTCNDPNVLAAAVLSMDKFNAAGFFHKDIKPHNMVTVVRRNQNFYIPIDYGMTGYIADSPYLRNKSNPPIDVFHLILFILQNSTGSRSPAFNNELNQLLIFYYIVLRRLGVSSADIAACSHTFNHYNLNVIFNNVLPALNARYTAQGNDNIYTNYIRNRVVSNPVKITGPINLNRIKNELRNLTHDYRARLPSPPRARLPSPPKARLPSPPRAQANRQYSPKNLALFNMYVNPSKKKSPPNKKIRLTLNPKTTLNFLPIKDKFVHPLDRVKRSPTALEKYINAFEEERRGVKIPSSKKKSPPRVPSPKKKSPSPPKPKDDEERQRLNRYLLTLNPQLPESLGPSKKKSKSKSKSPPGFFKKFKGLFGY